MTPGVSAPERFQTWSPLVMNGFLSDRLLPPFAPNPPGPAQKHFHTFQFYRNPYGAGLFGQSALSGPWRRSAPERRQKGPAERESGDGGDASTAPQYCWGAGIPLRGRTIRIARLMIIPILPAMRSARIYSALP